MKKSVFVFLTVLAVSFVSNNVFCERLDVPFLSQAYPEKPYYIGSWGPATHNCGPTSVIMAANFLLGTEPKPQDIKDVDDWMVEAGIINSVNGYNGEDTVTTDLVKLAKEYYGFPCVIIRQNSDITLLKAALAAGNPVIVGVNIDMNAKNYGHFMVVTEITDTGVKTNDPGHSEATTKKGKLQDKVFTFSQFKSSWATSNYATVVITKAGRFNDGIHEGSSEAIANCYVLHGGASTFGRAWDNGKGVWVHSWPDNSSDPDVINLQDFLNGANWWVIAYNKFEKKAFPIHGRILDKWIKAPGYDVYGPPLEAEKYWNAPNGHKIVYQHFTNTGILKVIAYDTATGLFLNELESKNIPFDPDNSVTTFKDALDEGGLDLILDLSGCGGGSSDSSGSTGHNGASTPEGLLPENIRVAAVWDKGCELRWDSNGARGYHISVFDREINTNEGLGNGCILYLPHPDAEYPIRVISYDQKRKTEPIIVKTLPRLKGSPSLSNDLPYLSIYPDTQLWLETASNPEAFGIIQQFKFTEAVNNSYTNLSYEDAGGIDDGSCLRVFNRYKDQRGTLHLERNGLELSENSYYVGSFFIKAEKDYTLVFEVARSIHPYGEQAYFNGTSRYQYFNIGTTWKKYVFMFKTENPDRDPRNISFKMMIGDLDGYLWIDSPHLRKVSEADLGNAIREEATMPSSQEYVLQPGPEDGQDMYMQLANVNNPANSPIDKWELRVGGWGEYDRWNTFLKFNLTSLPPYAEKATVWLYNFASDQPTGTRVSRVNTQWRWTDWWQVRFEGCPSWTQVGGISAPKNNAWCEVNITNMYNDWQSGKYMNHGFCLDAGGVTNKWDKFYSSNYTDDPSLRPKLVVTTKGFEVFVPPELTNY